MPIDPNDPMQAALFPIPPDLVWPPPEYAGLFTFAPPAAPTPEVPVGAAPQPIEAAIAPTGVEPAAAPAQVQPPPAAQLQPGLGIPTQAVDPAAMRAAPVDATNPWAVLESQEAPDPWAIRGFDDQDVQKAGAEIGETIAPLVPGALEMRLDDMSGAELADFARQNPRAHAKYVADKEGQQSVALAERVIADNKSDLDAQRLNAELRRQGLAKAEAAGRQVDQESANLAADGGFWDSRTDGQKILGLAAVFAGAFVAGPNGQNRALDIMERSIERHVANAKRKLADKRSAVAQMYARVGDDFLANETMRQGTMKAARDGLATFAVEFDPAGTAARNAAAKILQFDAQIAASAQRVQQYTEEKQLKEADLAIKAAKALADNRKTNAEADLLERKASGAGAGGGAAGGNVVLTPQQLGALYPGNPTPPIPMTGKQYDAWLGTAKKGQDLGAGGKVGEEERQAVRERTIPGFFDYGEDGQKKPFVMDKGATTAEAEKLRTKATATREVVSLLDEAMSIRTGWSSATGNSDEHAKLTAILGKTKLALKNAEDLGAITESDADLMEGALGAADFTRYKDIDTAVGQARKNMVGSLRNALVGAGMSAKAAAEFSIPNPYGHKRTAELPKGDADKLLAQVKQLDARLDAAEPKPGWNPEPLSDDERAAITRRREELWDAYLRGTAEQRIKERKHHDDTIKRSTGTAVKRDPATGEVQFE